MTTLAFGDEAYPVRLRTIFASPSPLYVRGQLTAADDLAVTIVGARRDPAGPGRAHEE